MFRKHFCKPKSNKPWKLLELEKITPTQEGSYCTSVLLLTFINLGPVYMKVGDPR